MRLYKYLTEQEFEKEIKSIIKNLNEEIHKNCKRYLKLIKRKKPVFRGMEVGDLSGIKKVRKSREPRGMNPKTFELFNNWLEKHRHNRRDKSVISTTSGVTALSFEVPYYIFPVNGFSYTGIKAADVNLDDNKTGGYKGVVSDYFSDKNVELDMKFENYFTTDKEFDKAYKGEFEIGFDCNKYYFLNAKAISNIAEGDNNEQIFKI